MLTGLPVLAFLAFDYLVAPPSDGGAAGVMQRFSAFSRGYDAAPGRTGEPEKGPLAPLADQTDHRRDASPAAVKSLIKSAVADVTSSGRSSLAASIQTELKRVGCYAGDADGTWNEPTRTAMTAFNTSVRVSFPTERPDYILLTLLQGHSAKACSRSCEGDPTHGAACVDRPIETRAMSPAGDRVVPSQVLIQKSPASTTVVRVAPSQAATGPVTVQHAPGAAPYGPAPVAVGAPLTREGAASSAPLPGRMAIGAPADVADEQTAAEASPHPAVEAEKPKAAPAPARPKPATAAAPSSRAQRMFSDLSVNSP